jgi:hypothetical protein
MSIAPDGTPHCAACEAPVIDRGTPGRVMVVGAVLTALGLFWIGATYTLAGKVMIFPFAFLVAGLFALVRGIQLRRMR